MSAPPPHTLGVALKRLDRLLQAPQLLGILLAVTQHALVRIQAGGTVGSMHAGGQCARGRDEGIEAGRVRRAACA